MRITYVVKPLKDGGYIGYCPDMDPVSVYGRTEKEASEKLVKVAKLYILRHPEYSKEIKLMELHV